MKLNLTFRRLLPALILGLSSGCVLVEETGELPSELFGKWYDKNYHFTFEIKEDGEGYIAATKQYYTVTIAGSHVRFKDKDTDSEKGSFYYSIDNGKIIMKSGSSAFSRFEDGSPFMKSGSRPQENGPPVELIGNWYREAYPTPDFKITEDGKIIISGDTTEYDLIISGNTVFVSIGAIKKGSFQYNIEYDKMFVSGGTDICTLLPNLSPFKKD